MEKSTNNNVASETDGLNLDDSKLQTVDLDLDQDDSTSKSQSVDLDLDDLRSQTVDLDTNTDDLKSQTVDLDPDDSRSNTNSVLTSQTVDLSINDSESNDSSVKMLPARNLQSGEGDDNYINLSDANQSVDMTILTTLPSGPNSAEEIAKHELRKLSLDQNGTFMVDFDPEKSNREMRKMNRRINTKDSKRNQLYDEKGILLEAPIDLCDCLEKECPGCHFPCQRCGSSKCGPDCRCHRKYTVDFIEVEGTEIIYNFPL